MGTPKLSIILISRNQAWNIPRLIESVLSRTACVLSREILLVDSASSDETVQVASQYPINVIRLQPGQKLTPAAGRYIGCKFTTGELILFLDGDMELRHGWLERALAVLEHRPDVAAVTGKLIDLPKTANAVDPLLPGAEAQQDEGEEIPYCGGAALYRRSVMEQAGGFNPYVHSDEEPDLCIRIRYAGYRIMSLAYPIAYHYSDPTGKLSTLVRRWQRNLYLGAGQNLRYHFGSELFWLYFKERGYGCFPLVGLLIGVASLLISFLFKQKLWFRLWLLMFAALVVGDAYRKRSLYRTVASLVERLLIIDGTIRGFVMQSPEPAVYPARLDMVKLINQHTTT